MELYALLESISRKEGIEAMKTRTIKRVKDDKDTVDKMSTGKFTINGLFKSTSGISHLLLMIGMNRKSY